MLPPASQFLLIQADFLEDEHTGAGVYWQSLLVTAVNPDLLLWLVPAGAMGCAVMPSMDAGLSARGRDILGPSSHGTSRLPQPAQSSSAGDTGWGIPWHKG